MPGKEETPVEAAHTQGLDVRLGGVAIVPKRVVIDTVNNWHSNSCPVFLDSGEQRR